MIQGWLPGAELAFPAAAFTIILAVAAIWLAGRSVVRWSFAAAMTLLGVEEIFKGLSLGAATPQAVLLWQMLRLAATALVPGCWIVFSLALARSDYRQILRSHRWLIVPAFVAPPLVLAAFAKSIFVSMPILGDQGEWILPLGLAGKLFQLLLLLAAVFILARLERTFRASVGHIRWQIKFVVLGLAILCSMWIYRASQALLYSSLDTSLGTIQSAALLGVDCLFLWAVARSRFLDIEVYMSRSSIQYSLTVFLVGVYLLAVGLLAQWVRHFTPQHALPWDSLVILFTLIGLGILLLSDRLRERLKRLIVHHFKRPLYDYRKAWMDLTERTREVVDAQELSTAVARIISETFSILSVHVWIREPGEPRLWLAGSTVFTHGQARDLVRRGKAVADVLEAADAAGFAVDLRERPMDWAQDMMRSMPDFYKEYPMRYILPMKVGNELTGIITLNDDRVGQAPLSIEDQDLLRAYSTQLAVGLLQIRLSEKQQEAREIESFQYVSTFLIHDLKNLSSSLSLTVQNLPVHFDNPEFRADALKVISQSVSRIGEMCGRLSILRQRIEPKMQKSDLNELAEKISEEFSSSLNGTLQKSLHPLPPVMMDPEQVRNVLTNLLLNAGQAIKSGGNIRISTERRADYGVISVSDDGCGMSQEFIEKSLFRPFRTTKSKGMGIGLFQCKMIIDAHKGRIEVESHEGEGSTFRVFLPLAPNGPTDSISSREANRSDRTQTSSVKQGT